MKCWFCGIGGARAKYEFEGRLFHFECLDAYLWPIEDNKEYVLREIADVLGTTEQNADRIIRIALERAKIRNGGHRRSNRNS